MPHRPIPLVTNEIYHVFNRSVAKQPIFLSPKDYLRAIEVIRFYSYQNTPMSFSRYMKTPKAERIEIMEKLQRSQELLIEIYTYCLMPNHFHFLLKQKEENGIKIFISNLQNSWAKYFNTKNRRSGALFQSMFKAVRIEDDEQFIHVARYIHLNPTTSYIIKNPTSLENYLWSSFPEYMIKKGFNITNKEQLMSYFKSSKDLKKFTLDQADYQRELDRIRHLMLE